MSDWTLKDGVLIHHGIEGQRWGHRNGPPYPLSDSQFSVAEKKAGAKFNYRNAKKQYSKDYNSAYGYSARHPISQHIKKSKQYEESNKRWEKALNSADNLNKSREEYKKTKQEWLDRRSEINKGYHKIEAEMYKKSGYKDSEERLEKLNSELEIREALKKMGLLNDRKSQLAYERLKLDRDYEALNGQELESLENTMVQDAMKAAYGKDYTKYQEENLAIALGATATIVGAIYAMKKLM